MIRSKNTACITSENLCTTKGFLELREDWSSLLEQSAQNGIFLSWEWHYTWWECFSKPKDTLQILLIKSSDKVVGLAPLYFQQSAYRGKTLRFIGTGEAEADEVVTEYLDFIALPGHEQTVIDTISDLIIEQNTWQRIEFNCVLKDYLCAQVAEQLKEKYSLQSHLNGRVFSTPLESSEIQYRETRLSTSRNKRLKRCLKALDKDGGGLTRKTIQDAPEIDTHLGILKKLHDERWSAKNKSSIFESKRFMDFHKKLLTLLVPQGKASIALYSLNEKPISAVYVMYSKNDCHYYQSGFSKEGENRYMPLFVSHIKEMNAARDLGFTNYDFMRGSTNSYKSDFGCLEADMFDLKIYRHTVEVKIVSVAKFLKQTCNALLTRSVSFTKSVRSKLFEQT